MNWEFCLRGTSWANLKMMMAVIPDIKTKDDDDNEKRPLSSKSIKSEVQNNLEEAGF
ncbi:hypothetical protein [Pedobacter sp. Leaf132]|uniref:hypothetical protein n=1 Tax=Pedobacter sp. Leaf132 TaxID=2876557 RepID=UPI001E47E0CD|nr:hypothetical protein [Pedobacter sp. Leaf132]